MTNTEQPRASKKCQWCGSTNLEFKETPESVHYGRLDCLDCNRWVEWVKNPEKVGRAETTKCKITYDFCKICLRTPNKLGWNETLTAHHIIPLEEGGLDIPENILVVCTACHKIINWIQLYVHKHLEKYYKKEDEGFDTRTVKEKGF